MDWILGIDSRTEVRGGDVHTATHRLRKALRLQRFIVSRYVAHAIESVRVDVEHDDGHTIRHETIVCAPSERDGFLSYDVKPELEIAAGSVLHVTTSVGIDSRVVMTAVGKRPEPSPGAGDDT